jgi:hypothetical protein
MAQSIWGTIQRVYADQGLPAVAALGFRKIIRPVARVGSLYFLERDLSLPMPPLEPISTIVPREGTLSDIPLLSVLPNAARHKHEAADRLMRGDRWFIGIDRVTGKLTNHRWISFTRTFIPELNRDLVVKPGQAYVYDLETAPEFRRRGIEAIMRQFTYDSLRRSYGVRSIVVYICADNHASLRAGRQYLTTICRVWFAQIGDASYIVAGKDRRMPDLRPIARPVVNQAAF